MEQKNLESKLRVGLMSRIRSSVGKYATIGAMALSLSYASGCGEGPSEECCEDISCPMEGSYGDKVCDGDEQGCYCREKSCCEKIDCNYNERCISHDSSCSCEERTYKP